MVGKSSNLFLHFKSDPNPDSFPTVWEHRQQQARSFISNPFEVQDSSPDEADIAELPVTGSPQVEAISEKKVLEEPQTPAQTAASVANRNYDVVWGEQPPEWLSLFYDLAWTATFSNLTSSSSFVDIKQTATYAVFFSIMWWIWVAQVFYTIDFYTDDWFHLVCIAAQFLIFGALAALTQGLDILTYITHSPGSDTWSSPSLMEIQPEEYLAQNSNGVMFQLIALVIAISRAILFILYLRVLIYAKLSSKSKRLPFQLIIVPAAIFISTGLFTAAYVVTKRRGEERDFAIMKLGLWVAGVVVEVAAHILRFQWDINDDELRLKSHGSIVGRFTGLTTIIVGEGINAIANTLYNIESAPGFRSKVFLGVGAAAIIIFLLVYLYFQGPAPQKPVRRRAAWAMLHWPWLLCVILLLEAVKNQLLLTNFLHSMWYLVDQTDAIMSSTVTGESQFNETFAKLLLQGGMTFVGQNEKLQELVAQNGTALNGTALSHQASEELVSVWYYRTLAQGVVNIYTSFMSNDTIDKDVQTNITRYLYHYDFTLQDYTSDATYNLRNIIWGLIEPSVYNARYIMVLSGCTFIILALLNLVQSWPRDRFQWASIISRFVLGLLVTSLVALNIGQYQTYFTPDGVADSQRASIFGWIDADGVLPTLAVAYVLQFILDTILVYLAKYFTRMRLGVSPQQRKVMKSA
ncbi:low temperature requirement protein LtrA [Ceratobasidium sp. AG-Ba]|nr:low temperature requirement protein LtrA [Ceratobasidium sp. AG-Ba]QRW04624.1 low temperature requirement protein LtrA [Ceratobasidium sp. AG-Ba]